MTGALLPLTAPPSGGTSVGTGWNSVTAWTVAVLTVALLALIARWASGRQRRRVDVGVATRAAKTSSRRTPEESPERRAPGDDRE